MSAIIAAIWSFFAFVGASVATRAGMIFAIAAVSLSLTAGLFLAIKGFIAGLMLAISYEPFLMVFWSIWPANAETCIAACLGADIAVFIYRYKIGLINSISNK